MSTAIAPLKVLLVDDEALARMRLRSMLQECADPASQVIAEAGDADAALALLRQQPCDLLLLDIGLPGLDGMQLAARLRGLSDPPSVVFVTAHAEHALRAFELDAADYLTKPVSRERLRSALQRVAQRRRAPEPPPATGADAARVLTVHDRGRVLRLPLADVLYLKAELKYVTLRTPAHSYVLDDPLSELEQRLGEGFLRVHRNALVARSAVRALQRRRGDGAGGDEGHAEHWAVQLMPTGEWLAVSRRQLAAVRE
ncbi:MAG: LytR/AlgR family response regulator transcription factor, partial [Giesbergeria sp.]